MLVAPLDWGLGHATRCIPLIRGLEEEGCEVLLGAEGPHAALLHEAFPALRILPLPGYGIRYGGGGFAWKMLQQLPRLRRAVRREQDWLRQQVREQGLQGVLSDNRLGLWHPGIPTVILTHQLRIRSPFPGTDALLQQINYRYLERFGECWVPDYAGAENLAGALAHPSRLPSRCRYIGPLSRFRYREGTGTRYDLLVLLSGPEPERSRLEALVMRQAPAAGRSMLIVRGLPGQQEDRRLTGGIRVVSHLDAEALNEALLGSALVLCRSGYSSVMDLLRLRRRAVLVPTPGQTEQEYLAQHLRQRGYFPFLPQRGFSLEVALRLAENFRRSQPPEEYHGYRSALRNFAERLGC